jgi:hypothetical protein
MRNEERKDSDESIGSITGEETVIITILPDGSVLLPRNANMPFLAEIARALGDEKAELFCKQAELSKVHIGKRMCG